MANQCNEGNSPGLAGLIGPEKPPRRWTVAGDVVIVVALAVIGVDVIDEAVHDGTLWNWISLGIAVLGVVGWVLILAGHLAARRRAAATAN